eukprot:TRINITY_DN25914_c0_g1_i1.p1 TRINITY_DN25914_c0_g1~~TRINITY_DN25914_c0_g1_i1.p1  ORF type:complete len:1037 (-),score=182.91 TRINITY_DN25914_c0_g1_i1:153-3263(-)
MTCQDFSFCEPEKWCVGDPRQTLPGPPPLNVQPPPIGGNLAGLAFAPPAQSQQAAPPQKLIVPPGGAAAATHTIQQPVPVEPYATVSTAASGYNSLIILEEEKKASDWMSPNTKDASKEINLQIEPKEIATAGPREVTFNTNPSGVEILANNEARPAQEVNVGAQIQRALVFDCGVLFLWITLAVSVALAGSSFEQPRCEIIEGSSFDYSVQEVKDYMRDLELFEQGLLKGSMPPLPEAPLACEACGEGPYFLPFGGEFVKSWPKPFCAVLYLVGLLYLFYGVAIVCDQFTEAIEAITAAQKVQWITSASTGIAHKVHVKVWNATIANLTLMALGSSAPEILLNVIEIVGSSFFAGALGPSTIVGSAAFNLLVITAVCVSAIPAGETRKIEGTTVYAITGVCSVWAYVWLIIILQLISPDKVDLWEALVTFFQFPLLAALAYFGDIGYFDRLCPSRAQPPGEGASDDEAEKQRKALTALYGKSISFEVAKQMAEALTSGGQAKPTSRSQYRKTVMKGITGAGKEAAKEMNDGNSVVMGFPQAKMKVLECCGKLTVQVQTSKPAGCPLKMRYTTVDGEAKGGQKYEHREGVLAFGPKDTLKTIDIKIIDNNVWEKETSFFVELTEVYAPDCAFPTRFDTSRVEIVILNDDEPGTLSWLAEDINVSNTADTVSLKVLRTDGTCGEITVNYETVSGSAKADKDFTATTGTLTFEDGEDCKTLNIPLARNSAWETTERFTVVLKDASAGVKFDKTTDGGETSAICTITIGAQKHNCCVTALAVACNCDMISGSMGEWRDAMASVIYVGGSPECQAEASGTDWLFHALSLLWKVVYSIVPPASLWGGWASFSVALIAIGTTTAFISDMAGLLGCSMGINDEITAITLVALGTSLPDTFASKNAAQAEPTADNSIGNVTGSNCVNVFLGLGLPWTIGAAYWASAGPNSDWLRKRYNGATIGDTFAKTYPDGGFIVPAGALGFSVTVFACCATCCFAILAYRRVTLGGELGGPSFAQKRDSIILVCLWFVYIIFSILKILGHI